MYVREKKLPSELKLPTRGSLDLTYRCNNNCRHCWIRVSGNEQESRNELSFDEIIRIVNQARALGCRDWNISGGEPMLRSDFADIFQYIVQNSRSYSLNTNGTLITPEIARLMSSGRGKNMISIYGATAEVHDYVTRIPGSFEAALRGFAYLKEADADFIVQIVPMRANYHQFDEMCSLAQSLSPYWRFGASWLYLTACGDRVRNKEIRYQRLDPKCVVDLDPPEVSISEQESCTSHKRETEYLFEECISDRDSFHVDPYGEMSFCHFVKDSSLRYDLRKGSFEECWNEFIPSLADKVRGSHEYFENCGTCRLRSDCRWCPVYGYLEHRCFSAKVEYLCEVAKRTREYKKNWLVHHRRYFEVAGITILFDSDIPITRYTFHPRLQRFEVSKPGGDVIAIRHHFSIPRLWNKNLGNKVYQDSSCKLYSRGNVWLYISYSSEGEAPMPQQILEFVNNRQVIIHNRSDIQFNKGNLTTLTLMPTDYLMLASVLADMRACLIRSTTAYLNNGGVVCIGCSDSELELLEIERAIREHADIFSCGEVIVKRQLEGFRVYQTWSSTDVSTLPIRDAPLIAICFMVQSHRNVFEQLRSKEEIIDRMLPSLVKPLGIYNAFDKMVSAVDELASEVRCYIVDFGNVRHMLRFLNGY